MYGLVGMPRVNPASKGLYLGLIIGGLGGTLVFGGIFFAMFAVDPEQEDSMLPFIPLMGAVVCALVSGITWLVLVWKGWAAIQDGYAEMPPASAVLLLFIPCFNLYWAFRCYPGLARGVNSLAYRYQVRGAEMSEGLFTTYAIMGLVGLIP